MDRIILCCLLCVGSVRAGDATTLEIQANAIVLRGAEVHIGASGQQPILWTDLKKPYRFESAQTVDLNFIPKNGLPVTLAKQWSPKPGANTIKLLDHLGYITVIGDDLPRVERIVLTAEKDPGPGEKGHQPIQKSLDYRTELYAPPGFYDVWAVPDNGSKPQRIGERIRIQAGRETRVPE